MRRLSEDGLASLSDHHLLGAGAFVDRVPRLATDRLAVTCPSSGVVIASVACGDEELARCAIDRAADALPDWRGRLPGERAHILRRWAMLVRENQTDLAMILTLEQGKPITEARGEIDYAASYLDWFAGEAERCFGQSIPAHRPGMQMHVEWAPVGIAAAVTPWNFPSAMVARKAAAALAAGCAMIVKPAMETPLSALALALLARRAGVPDDILIILTGEAAPLVGPLMADSRVRALSFTGSTQTGRLLLAQAAGTVKRVSMELGGHAPFILFDDAQVDRAVADCIAAKFATSGQDCLAANRIFVHRPIHDHFIDAFARATDALAVGHGLAPDTLIGPMTTAAGADKGRAHIADAIARGARRATRRTIMGDGGAFVAPTLLRDVTEDMQVAREESFAPVAPVLAFDHEDEVIARANAGEYGLAAYLYTDDVRRAARVSRQLEYGMVGVNTPRFTGPPIPFGGWKQSGLGREGGSAGITEYMEQRYVCSAFR